MDVNDSHKSMPVEELLGRRLNDVELKFAPGMLHCSGSVDIPLPPSRVSIIGSRKASELGLVEARKIVRFLTKNNVTIVSGLARGIDTMAHTTAMECQGRTIAVIGTPLNREYPKENSELQKAIMKDHLVISQYPVGHITKPRDFVLRNRTMALISDGTIVVEAGESSGSLHHCWEALRLRRPLFICRTVLENDSLRWPKKMMKYGAMKLDNPADIMENIPPSITAPSLFQGPD